VNGRACCTAFLQYSIGCSRLTSTVPDKGSETSSGSLRIPVKVSLASMCALQRPAAYAQACCHAKAEVFEWRQLGVSAILCTSHAGGGGSQ